MWLQLLDGTGRTFFRFMARNGTGEAYESNPTALQLSPPCTSSGFRLRNPRS